MSNVYFIRSTNLCVGIPKTAQGQSVEMARKILVVDDEPDICFVVEKTLGENGFRIDSYEDPLLALENFKSHSYGLVILDIRMPDLNGFTIYREIRILDKKIKICFLTAGEMYTGIQIYFLHYLPIILLENQSITNY